MTDIAILIMAHKNEGQLNQLVGHLRAAFTVYVHIDRRARIAVEPHERVQVLAKRYRVHYGSFDQILARLALLAAAVKNHHQYYLIISGQDLPIASNAAISDFFGSARGKDYYLHRRISVGESGSNPEDARILRRLVYFWQDRSKGLVPFYTFLLVRKVQDLLRWYRRVDFVPHRGSDWFNFHHDSVACILNYVDQNPTLLRRFRCTLLGAALFFQTVLQDSARARFVVNDDLRYVLFEGRRHPRVLKMGDFDALMRSGKLFARKFDPGVDKDVMERILCSLVEHDRR